MELATGKTVPFQARARNGFANNNQGGRERWMPEGRAIAYIDEDDNGAWGIFHQDFIPGKDTYSARRPIAGFDPGRTVETFGISPDGTQAALGELEVLSSLVLVKNVPGVKRPSQK